MTEIINHALAPLTLCAGMMIDEVVGQQHGAFFASGVLVQAFPLSLESYRYDLVYSPRAIDRPATTLLRNWVKSEFAS